jgi:hypothetical protein
MVAGRKLEMDYVPAEQKMDYAQAMGGVPR